MLHGASWFVLDLCKFLGDFYRTAHLDVWQLSDTDWLSQASGYVQRELFR